MLADPAAELTRALGFEFDATAGLGSIRSRRWVDALADASQGQTGWVPLIPPRPCTITTHPVTPSPPPLCRFSAVIEDGIFKSLNLESTGEMSCSLSNQILEQLKQ
jgi:peroxiredoxin